MTSRTPQDLADKQSGPLERFVRGMIRRVTVTLTTGSLWQTLGYRGGANAKGGDETANYEPFTGIGFYSIPPASGAPEAIVAAYGSTRTAALVAMRDEATRQTGAGDLVAGDVCVYNDLARIIVKGNGTVEIRLHGGVAIPLATMADVAAIGTAIAGATIVPNDGGASLKATILAGLSSSLHGAAGSTTWPVGTTVLKAQ